MSLQDKIKERMDILQDMMEDNVHMDSPDIVEEHITTVSKFWSVLSEEDRDYIHGARYAIEEKLEWKV
jgi:hypothetical protein